MKKRKILLLLGALLLTSCVQRGNATIETQETQLTKSLTIQKILIELLKIDDSGKIILLYNIENYDAAAKIGILYNNNLIVTLE